MKNLKKYSALVTTILLSVALAGPANAIEPERSAPTPKVQPEISAISAVSTASLKFDRPAIKTAPASVAVEPVKVQQADPVPATPAVPSTSPAPVQTPRASVHATVKAAPVAPVSSSKGAAILASAYGQVGTIQDCTAMVEKALGSIGIVTGDLAPAQFFQFGTVVSTPAPGDILISAGHVGIYAGNGQMVSGGFNGNQTVVHPVSYVGGFTAVRVA